MNSKGLVVCPLVAVSHKHVDIDIACLSRQLTPLAHGWLHLVLTYHLYAVSLIASNHSIGLCVELEGQRGDVLRNGHVDNVRIDLGQFLTLCIALRHADRAC